MVIKHLDKIYTFLIIQKELSFSKASKILNISQPAVTQQIRILENYLGVSLFERKKSGVELTKEGMEFLKIAKEFEKFLYKFEKNIEKFKEMDTPFLVGASQTVGNYILPECMKYIKSLLNKEINLIIKNNDSLIEDLKKGSIDIAFLTKKVDELHSVKWLEDELVVFSNKPIAPTLELKDLKKYKVICREPDSSTREFIKKEFEKVGFDCDNLNIISLVHNSTAIKNTILNSSEQLLSIISKSVIKDELKSKRLYSAKLKEIELKRPIYAVYKFENKDIESVMKFLQS